MTLDQLDSSNPEIAQLARDYFDLMHHQNMNLFDRVFHPESVLYGVVDNKLSKRSCAIYKQEMMNRTSPADLGNTRRDLVLSFDQVSPTLALLKMQLEMFGGVMQDYLNIVYLDGQWWVMAKMWEKVGTVEG
ncbi:MAG: hypothetical protein F2791_02695 [Actinobacteria bacterium]|jgi:hypothetical protein|uniref:Unannotated protein n=1 Tax=freshwater metagenome TaxID=449393 RepID=A0A6J6DGV4_9ZZZZ|nr:hypothetical protein [Actinomycetota bacterium]MTA83859.1 hypothetical protein [Actinomycetota bacterium]